MYQQRTAGAGMWGRKNIWNSLATNLRFEETVCSVEPQTIGLTVRARFYRVFSGTLPVRRVYTNTSKCIYPDSSLARISFRG
jgi:hypothetical protein